MRKRKSKSKADRFGIGEWFGRSFVKLTTDERQFFSAEALKKMGPDTPPCPFVGDGTSPCTKQGGICSLRLYHLTDEGTGEAIPVHGTDGDFRTLCPNRFKQANAIYAEIGKLLVGSDRPLIVAEVRFLQRMTADDEGASESEDVGNIDIVLVNPDLEKLQWCALETQAVYFSGPGMPGLIRYIQSYNGPGLPFPEQTRRPDYRSSGPKRLMPQLQIKVPTLRRWGKKMAVVVDDAWFRHNVIDVTTVADLSNCDIAWFVVSFEHDFDVVSKIVTTLLS